MKAHRFLEEKGLNYEVVEQDNPTKSCDAAARERGVKTSQIVKSLIVEKHREKGVNKGDLVHVLLPGDREISEKKFGEHHLIDPEKSKEITGFESGTVHPFSTEIDHVIDFRILEQERLSFTVGETQKGIIIKENEFEKALDNSSFDFEVKDISQTLTEDIELLESRGLEEEDARFVADRGLIPEYLALNFEDDIVLKAFREFLRHDLHIEQELIAEIIEASENLNNLQKIIEEYSETGEITETEEFNLKEVIEEVFDERPEALEDLKSGKDSVANFIIGEVMKKTSGRARPEKVKEVLRDEY